MISVNPEYDATYGLEWEARFRSMRLLEQCRLNRKKVSDKVDEPVIVKREKTDERAS